METIEKIELSEAVRWGREALGEMLSSNKRTTDDIDARALHTLIVYANCVDSRTVAGSCLIVGGFLCAVLALLLGIIGAALAIAGKNVTSGTVGIYTLTFGLFAVVQFLVVRLTRKHKG